jgi:hypothetical protein
MERSLDQVAAETMTILQEMRSELPVTALGTPSWSRLNRLEDSLLRVIGEAACCEPKSA